MWSYEEHNRFPESGFAFEFTAKCTIQQCPHFVMLTIENLLCGDYLQKGLLSFILLRMKLNKCSYNQIICQVLKRWRRNKTMASQHMDAYRQDVEEVNFLCSRTHSTCFFFFFSSWLLPTFCSFQPGHLPCLILPSPSSSEKTFLIPFITGPTPAPLTHLLSTPHTYPHKNVIH